jgi:hypothetical protein
VSIQDTNNFIQRKQTYYSKTPYKRKHQNKNVKHTKARRQLQGGMLEALKTPYTSIHDELLEEKSSPKQVEEVLIAKSQSLQSQDLAINPESSIPPKSSKGKKRFHLWKSLLKLRMIFFMLILEKH